MADMPSTSKRLTRKTNKPLLTADIENELSNGLFHLSSSSSESDSGNDIDKVSANNDSNMYLD